MKRQILSQTPSGKWAGILTLAFIILMALKSIRLPLPSPVIAVLGVVGFILAVISIIKNKDRSLLTWLAIPVGLIIIFWAGAEIMYPH